MNLKRRTRLKTVRGRQVVYRREMKVRRGAQDEDQTQSYLG